MYNIYYISFIYIYIYKFYIYIHICNVCKCSMYYIRNKCNTYISIYIYNQESSFLVKMGVPYRGFVFALRMYRFCRSNALYSASLSFRMLAFLLTPFNT